MHEVRRYFRGRIIAKTMKEIVVSRKEFHVI
jgi:hypothetical protein